MMNKLQEKARRAETEFLLDKMSRTISQLMDSLHPYPSDALALPESAEQWSVLQVLDHLVSVHIGTIRYLEKKILSPELATVTWRNRLRFYLLRMALKLPFKYKMPSSLPIPSNQNGLEYIQEQYLSAHNDLTDMVHNLSDGLLIREVFKHPVAGRLSISQTLSFLIDHIHHHQHQINRILKKNSFGKF